MKPAKHLRVQKQTGTQTEENIIGSQVVDPIVKGQINQSIQDSNQPGYDDLTESSHSSVPDDSSHDGYQPEPRQRVHDDFSQDGYHSEPRQRIHRYNDFKLGYHQQRGK